MRARQLDVETIWSCEFYDLKWNVASRFPEFMKEYPTTWNQPIHTRDSFYGGRTNAACLYYKCAPGQRIQYVDFTSLYPSVNKYGIYPVGHPEIILTPSLEMLQRREYFGIVKCRVLAPRRLFHPVLPIRHSGKLVFQLCRACTILGFRECGHNDEDRAFIGTWCTPEVYKAMDKGYRVLAVREVHHFAKQKTGLFAEYVNTFLKVKEQASGWPKSNMSDEEKRDHVNDYARRENISLDIDKIEYNPGLRVTTKLILNALWGKFGQRGNMPQSQICMINKDFYRVVLNDRFEVTGFFRCPSNQQVVELIYEEKEFTAKEPKNTNVYVASFTTSIARLKLYDVLDQLGDRVLYYDTDSVIYYHHIDDPPHILPRLGKFLGELTNELCDDGTRWIDEFVSTGPKSYSYRDNHGRIQCKFKGISKTLFNLRVVNFKSMLRCIQQGVVYQIEGVKNLTFKLDRYGRIKTKYQAKVFRMVYDKRYIVEPGFKTFPFGY